jgi:RimJ/RimL family protein N-acetyltransferase
MKYFRQDSPITFEEQQKFIRRDMGAYGDYNGRVIEFHGKPVGLCGVKNTGEFTLGLLPEYQGKGIATAAMRQLITKNKPQRIWSEVFVGNPALEWFISVLGFHIVAVQEQAYYKKGLGYVSVVLIEQ